LDYFGQGLKTTLDELEIRFGALHILGNYTHFVLRPLLVLAAQTRTHDGNTELEKIKLLNLKAEAMAQWPAQGCNCEEEINDMNEWDEVRPFMIGHNPKRLLPRLRGKDTQGVEDSDSYNLEWLEDT